MKHKLKHRRDLAWGLIVLLVVVALFLMNESRL